VINLSPDKPQVFREAFRVLKPGGAIVVSDIVLNRTLPQAALDSAQLYAACIAGALLKDEYLAAIHAAGFAQVEVLSEKVYLTQQGSCDPVTSSIAKDLAGVASPEDLSGAASSITVSAMKA
jgi:arsenite methyltransferase